MEGFDAKLGFGKEAEVSSWKRQNENTRSVLGEGDVTSCQVVEEQILWC